MPQALSARALPCHLERTVHPFPMFATPCLAPEYPATLADCQSPLDSHPPTNMPPSSKAAAHGRRRSKTRRLLGLAATAFLAVPFLILVGVLFALRLSLPRLSGTVHVPRIENIEALIERDDQGHVTVRARSRNDAARALGYAHAQDRFFQMDLLRRAGSGRLSALLGPAMLAQDRKARIFRGHALAAQALPLLAPNDRAALLAYTEGVNAALDAMAVPPPEYLLLRAAPEPWQPEDSLVLNLTFSFLLQDPEARNDLERTLLRDALGPVAYRFFHPSGSHLDATLDHHVEPESPLPAPADFTAPMPPPAAALNAISAPPPHHAPDLPGAEPFVPGSNAWAVSGAFTESGAALVADDMHLLISVPGIWYRAVIRWTDDLGHERLLAGVTVPGAPTLITGSNGHVAWGFTNSMLDTSDLIELRLDPDHPDHYLTPDGWRPFTVHDEPILVAHSAPGSFRVTNTVWGPVLGSSPSGHLHAVAWAMARPEALVAHSSALENATNVTQAIAAAHAAARPVQNFVVGDRSGAIGWTLIGILPDRGSGTGEFAEDWSQPGAPWRGLLPPSKRPVVLNPPHGRIWTANQRILGASAYLALGNGGWDLGARAARIRDDLMALSRATPADMLAIQLDDSIPMLRPWHQRLLDALRSIAASSPSNAPAWNVAIARLRDWDGRASADSLALPVVARFRRHALHLLHEPVAWAVGQAPRNPGPEDVHVYFHYQFRPGPHAERVAERLLKDRPAHLLNPRWPSYDALLAEAARRAILGPSNSIPPTLRPWGDINRTAIRHRLSPALPSWLSRWLDMPPQPQPGFHYGLPRVAGPDFGASQRFGIEPGREPDAYLHTPAGQSGHFLSPFYRNSQPDWLRGRPTPLLGNPPVHRLVLSSRKG